MFAKYMVLFSSKEKFSDFVYYFLHKNVHYTYNYEENISL
jgi:hypothetical protein